MNTLNGQNNDHDQELLHAIEQIVQQESHTTHDPHSPLGVGARLAGTVPQPDAAFAARLEARLVAVAEQRKEESSMHTTNRRFTKQFAPIQNRLRLPRFVLRSAIVGLVGLVLVGGWQLNTLTAQARVERMAQRFGLVVIYPEVIEAGLPSVAPEPLATDQAEPVPSAQAYVPQKLGLEEAQQRTPFPIRLPTWLPSNLEMTALDVGEGGWGCNSQEECANAKPPVSVVVMYKTPGDTWNGIILQATEITPQSGGGYVVPAAGIQSVTMSGLPAIYVGGAAQGSTEDMDKMVWNAAVDQHMLSWEQDGLIYVLQASGLGFTREDVIRIAESLQPGG